MMTVVALAAGGLAATAQANDACLDFKWDVSKERALFAAKPAALTAGKALERAPVVVSNGTLVAAEDFQGQKGCSAPHKIVTFNLAGEQPFVLQLSNATNETVLLTVTPSPSRKL